MVSSPRDKILNKLRAARKPFEDVNPIEEKRHVAPLADQSTDELYELFVDEAKKLACNVYEPISHGDALEIVIGLLGDDDKTLMWDSDYIPLNGLQDALDQKDIKSAELRDSDVRVGITGVDAALAATGSLVVMSTAGKARQTSLLPLVHIAIVKKDQIVANLETFLTKNKNEIQNSSNIAVISGPSKSADIAMELIHGMHGPGEVHIVIIA